MSLDKTIFKTKSICKRYNISSKVISSVETRALRSSRKLTGKFPSNRQSRWLLDKKDPQYATETQAKKVLLKLLISLFEFNGAPTLDLKSKQYLEKILKCSIHPNSYVDPLTLEPLSFQHFIYEAENPKHGYSDFHMGHLNPTMPRRHRSSNIAWVTKLSNSIQGDMNITEAQNRIRSIAIRLEKQ